MHAGDARHAAGPVVEGTALALGIDNLGALEDLFGEMLGGEIAAAVRDRIAPVLPPGAPIRETSRRRFLMCLPALDETRTAILTETLQAVVAGDPILTGQGPVAVTLSAGLASGPLDSETETRAMHSLHHAMAKGVGTLRVARDDSALLDYRARLLTASRAAIGAVGDEDLAIAFQPVVRATGGRTISFHECLVRIRQADGRLLTAASFMPALERLGLAPFIDRQVLMMTFEALVRYPSARFSVNIFPQTMQDAQWMTSFEHAVASDPTLAERLIVEVTETAALLDMPRTRKFMDKLRDHGVSFAIDDFGAGHTSLAYLRDLRFDMIKIDGSFVRDVDQDSDNAFLIDTLVRIAERFDMMTVAETVQTPAEARCLAELGVGFFQGFQFGSPSLILEPTTSPMPMVAAQA